MSDDSMRVTDLENRMADLEDAVNELRDAVKVLQGSAKNGCGPSETPEYRDYIQHWEENFGEATTGEYGYWRGADHFPSQVHLLSQAEFEQHTIALNQASEKFMAAHKAGDQLGMKAALEESLPHEVALIL